MRSCGGEDRDSAVRSTTEVGDATSLLLDTLHDDLPRSTDGCMHTPVDSHIRSEGCSCCKQEARQTSDW